VKVINNLILMIILMCINNDNVLMKWNNINNDNNDNE